MARLAKYEKFDELAEDLKKAEELNKELENPFNMQPSRPDGLLDQGMKSDGFAVAIIVANTGVGLSQDIVWAK